jgi:hypothetical protein
VDKSRTRKLDAQVENLKKRGVSLPRNTARAQLTAAQMHQMGSLGIERRHAALLGKDVNFGKPGAATTIKQLEEQNRIAQEMGRSRRRMSRTGGMGRLGSLGSSDLYAAIPRFYDPIEYWDLSGLPWNMADEGHRHKLHKWMRLYYATHHLVPILIDIFTRFPLVGMEFESKDKKLVQFHEDLFFDTLQYDEFFVGLGREYWTVGEAFPLGSFDEDLGVWEREELINPEDVVIENFPLLGEKEMKIVPPDYLKKLAQTMSPPKEYKQLEINFPELIPYLRRNEHIPISGVLLKQVANKLTNWDDHGTPILLRGLRTLIHEEKLLASQDAIAERLYSPLILAKLGVMDLGDGQGPWVPDPSELDSFRDDMDLALSSDFRLLVHHFGLEVESVFGREQMPRLGDDFDRIERRIMQVFGVNPSLLSAGSNSQPYASSALQAEFLNQILRTFQGYLKKHYRDRALVVAEAQQHYEYELKGQTRIPVMEEVVEYDDEGNKRIVEKHKLLIPDLNFATLDLRDEATERQFFQTLRQMGVPIPDEKLMIGVDVDFEDMVNEYNEELIKKTIAQQEGKVKAYKALDAANLPIPADLKAEVESVLGGGQGGAPPPPGGGALPGMPSAGGGLGGPPSPGGGVGGAIMMPPTPEGLGPGGAGGAVPGGGPPPAGPGANSGQGGGATAPAVSMERRQGLSSKQAGNQSDPIVDSVTDRVTLDPSTERVVNELPRSKTSRKYTLIESDEPESP